MVPIDTSTPSLYFPVTKYYNLLAPMSPFRRNKSSKFPTQQPNSLKNPTLIRFPNTHFPNFKTQKRNFTTNSSSSSSSPSPIADEKILPDIETLLRRFWKVAKPYWSLEDKAQARLGYFFNALANKDQEQFTKQLLYYLGGFAGGIPVSTLLHLLRECYAVKDSEKVGRPLGGVTALSSAALSWLIYAQAAYCATDIKIGPVYEVAELFELGIQLSYLLLLLALLGVGTFFVIRQVLVRRELDLSAKELQEQVRSGDASATGLFELGAVMLRRKFYPAATKYLLQAIEKWDGDDQDLAQVYNALGVSYVRDEKLEKGISQFEYAVKLQPGYVTAWNNLGDAYEKKKDLKSALKAFEEALLFDPNNKLARARVESLRDRVNMYKGVPVKSKER